VTKKKSSKIKDQKLALKRKPRSLTLIRLGLVLLTLLVVGVVALGASYYARGYRFDSTTGSVEPNGILVLKSVPDSAQIFINGQLKTATNATIPLPPNTYDVTMKKEGFMDWNKRVTIDKEVVTEATAYLFRSAPSLSSMTFSGITTVIPNDDLSKIAYVVPPSSNSLDEDNAGLWVMEILNLPLGFSREPRKVTDGDLTDATWSWSPDGSQILLTTKTGVYLLPSNTLTVQSKRINIANTKAQILANWETQYQTKLDSDLTLLPEEMQDILKRKAKAIAFSPDEKMVLYTASASGNIPSELIPPLPGSSTQKEDRNIKENHTYIYDLEEDRNFEIDQSPVTLINDWRRFLDLPSGSPTPTPSKKAVGIPVISPILNGNLKTKTDSLVETGNSSRSISWFPTSRHVVLSEAGKIIIMDYDGTNQKTVYSGSYVPPHAYPSLNSDSLLLLTNLGSNGIPNLYSLSLR
jgi:hypothetical protein